MFVLSILQVLNRFRWLHSDLKILDEMYQYYHDKNWYHSLFFGFLWKHKIRDLRQSVDRKSGYFRVRYYSSYAPFVLNMNLSLYRIGEVSNDYEQVHGCMGEFK
jgi:hypothetical protein